MGREEGGEEGGLPQPFLWLLCIWVIIIFVTIQIKSVSRMEGQAPWGEGSKKLGALGGE